MVCIMAGVLILNGVVGVECLVYKRRQGALYQACFSPQQRGGGMDGVM
jgi:hypothetical protein